MKLDKRMITEMMNISHIVKKLKKLPCFQEDFPSWGLRNQVELGIMEVDVEDIIGGDIHASKDYSENWNPVQVGFDLRYERVSKLVKLKMKKAKENGNDVLNLGWIHLFKFYSKSLEKFIFYVCMDGHRRVSAAHMLNVKTILADVTEVKNR